MEMSKKFFIVTKLRHWNRLLREVVDAPSPETSKARLDVAFSKLNEDKVSLIIAGGLETDDLQGPFLTQTILGLSDSKYY